MLTWTPHGLGRNYATCVDNSLCAFFYNHYVVQRL